MAISERRSSWRNLMDVLETRDYFDTPAGSVILPAGFDLETRQRDEPIDVLRGFFPYESRAIISDRGPIRKEQIASHGFGYAINDPEQREITFLYGHSFDSPVASRKAGSLDILDSAEGVGFEARLPSPELRTPNQNQLVKLLRQKLIGGLSPGFRIPQASAVGRQPVSIIPEPGNPGVNIRRIHDAVLYEISAVQRAAYRSILWTQKSFFHTRLALTGMVALFMEIERLLGRDYLSKLRKEIRGNERIRAKDRRTWDEVVEDGIDEGLDASAAEELADEIAGNNLAMDTRSNAPETEKYYRWL